MFNYKMHYIVYTIGEGLVVFNLNSKVIFRFKPKLYKRIIKLFKYMLFMICLFIFIYVLIQGGGLRERKKKFNLPPGQCSNYAPNKYIII